MTPLPRLMVAPNGARKTKADHPNLPITIDEVVATAIDCHAQGADGLHLHVRDENGGHTLDPGLYRAALNALGAAVPDMALQITTEAVGMYSAAQQRAVVERVQPQNVSICLAEMLSDNEFREAAIFYDRCADTDINVQHILFGPSDLDLMTRMLTDGSIAKTELQLLFVLGRYSAGQQSSPQDLDPFIDWLKTLDHPPDWAICAFGKQETQCLAHAHSLGGKIRVGFENSFWNADGTLASSNADRVAEMQRVLQPPTPV